MAPETSPSSLNLPDVTEFVATLRREPRFFDRDAEIVIARAPGRLDLMGGIADYSGSLVLEMPLAEAALVALQKRDTRQLTFTSLGADANYRSSSCELSLDEFYEGERVISYEAAQAMFRRDRRASWVAYIAGAFLVLMRERGIHFARGARILIDSRVPEGKGVSSSAAIEVATMSAIAAAYDIEVETGELARLCQKVENLVVGAPCGIMDQMTSAAGEAGKLLALVCQPAELLGAIGIPDELAVWGLDSGIRHSVGGGDYASVRTGAFMGYRMIAELAGLTVKPADREGRVRIDDPKWQGYLANLTPTEFEKDYAPHLPQRMTGAEFLACYQGITDTLTRVEPEETYAVLNPTAHPIYENARVRRFADVLTGSIKNDEASELGASMYGSHESYSACGLGSSGTDILVELVKQYPDLYGAKITGGGSGGTVAVLGQRGAEESVRRVAVEYESQTGYRPYIFSGSSTGAAGFAALRINANE